MVEVGVTERASEYLRKKDVAMSMTDRILRYDGKTQGGQSMLGHSFHGVKCPRIYIWPGSPCSYT